MNTPELSGVWHSKYAYQPSSSPEPISDEHIITLTQIGRSVTAVSHPQEDGSTLQLNLHYNPDTRTLSGSWSERTSPDGRYKGRIFSGVLHLLVDHAGTTADGKWLGVNSTGTTIKDGRWVLTKQEP